MVRRLSIDGLEIADHAYALDDSRIVYSGDARALAADKPASAPSGAGRGGMGAVIAGSVQ
jgi:ABC-type branched-subunit amino acid transport system ATPase component